MAVTKETEKWSQKLVNKKNVESIKTKKKIHKHTLHHKQILIPSSGEHHQSLAGSIMKNVPFLAKENIRETFSNFQNIEHRLEFVARRRGLEFINDSAAFNVHATWYSLETMKTSTIWITSGWDDQADYDLLRSLVDEKVRIMICIGRHNIHLHQYFQQEISVMFTAQSMNEAVSIACRFGKNKETVLLSPAVASFDLFDDYIDQGNQFKKTVWQL